ncbi:MAG: STAS domain-containing protein [Magnetococcales bacterium]|nr:STAS domain-containing protein [Magnetococcales bacterium]
MVTLSESDGWVTLQLPAEFDFKMHKELRACYCNRPPEQRYRIDFKEVTRIDSSTLGMLLLMRSYCGDDRARIQLINCNPKVKGLLNTATFYNYFPIS